MAWQRIANTRTYESIGPQTTNGTKFTPLPGPEMSPIGIGAHITPQRRNDKGKARFRFASEDFDPRLLPIPPDGVVFTAPAANSYAFFDRDSCGDADSC